MVVQRMLLKRAQYVFTHVPGRDACRRAEPLAVYLLASRSMSRGLKAFGA